MSDTDSESFYDALDYTPTRSYLQTSEKAEFHHNVKDVLNSLHNEDLDLSSQQLDITLTRNQLNTDATKSDRSSHLVLQSDRRSFDTSNVQRRFDSLPDLLHSHAMPQITESTEQHSSAASPGTKMKPSQSFSLPWNFAVTDEQPPGVVPTSDQVISEPNDKKSDQLSVLFSIPDVVHDAGDLTDESRITLSSDKPSVVSSAASSAASSTLSSSALVVPPRRKKTRHAADSSKSMQRHTVTSTPIHTADTTLQVTFTEHPHGLPIGTSIDNKPLENSFLFSSTEDRENDSETVIQNVTSGVRHVTVHEDNDLDVTVVAEQEHHQNNEQVKSTAEINKETSREDDKDVLDSVFVLNLDSGESVPLSSAEERLSKTINPLSQHIMRRAKEYSSESVHPNNNVSDDDASGNSQMPSHTVTVLKPTRTKRRKLKKLLDRTVNKLKTAADDVFHTEESASEDDEPVDGRTLIKIKASHSHKGPYDFDLLVPVQEFASQHLGAVWTMKFSQCGRLLATGGQDNLLRVWVLRDAYNYFDDMRNKYSEVGATEAKKTETTSAPLNDGAKPNEDEVEHTPFMAQPFQVYRGHTADLLDVSWSKNLFILSSSMDKTVRLWHVSRQECLCCFQHIDFVTAIAFYPKDDRYFLSGSLDGKLRMWSIPEKRVALWNEVSGSSSLITAANFCLNGQFVVIGTYDGRCIFYTTEQLKYYTQILVRSTRGRNARGRKITGVEPYPGQDKILVTSNDSRLRLYDLRDLSLTSKFKGCSNNSSQIKASFSSDGKYVVCGSEDHFVYIWRSQHNFHKCSSARRDRNDFWEAVRAHGAVVTVAIFAPSPQLIIKQQFQFVDSDDRDVGMKGEVLVSADYNGVIKIFINKFQPDTT